MINLYEQLPEIEKTRLNNYIHRWGVKSDFIGLENWLSNWNYSKQKLYKLLGNQFVYSQNITYEKDKNEIQRDIDKIKSDFPCHWRTFIHFLSCFDLYLKGEYNQHIYHNGDYFNNKETEYALVDFVLSETLADGKVPENVFIKERKPNAAREFRMQKGAKIFRAITQTLKYYNDEVEEWQRYWKKEFKEEIDLFKELEEYRVKYSIVVNDKKFTGKLHISINPIDYITMSDNNSKWTSCMSWTDSGCYHEGTIEMMNSNNVLCCYITKGKSEGYDFFYRDEFYRDEDKKEDSEDRNIDEWNCSDKKWRVLFYITKDIIVGGKAYPFINNDLSKIILKIIKDLAKKNLNWNYQFGPELYKDMKYIRSEYAMNRARGYMKYSPRKKNILFDTKGMYNDMIGNKHLEYWCYRNKVNKTKVISYSGKAPCLCCGGSIIELSDESYYDEDVDEYHDKYLNCSNVICETCLDEKFSCFSCGVIDPLADHKEFNGHRYCTECLETKLKICPSCGKPYIVESSKNYYIKNKYPTKSYTMERSFDEQYNAKSENANKYSIIRFHCCPDCLKEKEDSFEEKGIKPTSFYIPHKIIKVTKKEYDFNNPGINKFFEWNLKPADLNKI